MNATQNTKSGLTLEQQIGFINLTEDGRNVAPRAARIGQLFADAVVWICRKFERPESGMFVKPSPTYWNPSQKNSHGITRHDLDMYAML